MVNVECERIWNEVVVRLAEYCKEGLEENHKKPQSEYPMSLMRFEPGTSEALLLEPALLACSRHSCCPYIL
jgi:hypothetical protein